MVQNYRPVFLNNNGEILAWVDPTNYGKGGADLTMMDFLQRGCSIVPSIEMLLIEKGRMNGARLVWAGQYAPTAPTEASAAEPAQNLYKMCTKELELVPEEADASYYRYIVNHTKGQVINKERSEKYTNIQPLPLLTAEGNGFGYGDYSIDHNLVGYWAYDQISIEKCKPANYIELIFDLP
jgi:hypothetical protein